MGMATFGGKVEVLGSKFQIGTLGADRELLKSLGTIEIFKLLVRHGTEDHGTVGEFEAGANREALARGWGFVVSHYEKVAVCTYLPEKQRERGPLTVVISLEDLPLFQLTITGMEGAGNGKEDLN